jgi:hypothetical protein
MNAGSVPSPEPQNTQMLIEDVESIENEDEEGVIVMVEVINEFDPHRESFR